MNKQSDWVEFVTAIGIVSAAVLAFFVPWSAFGTWLAGDRPPAEVFAFIVTPLGAVAAVIGIVVNGHFARRTLRQAQASDLASRYQKGVELLAAEAQSTKLGGVELLSMVAREAPLQFQTPVIRTLRQVIVERGEDRIVEEKFDRSLHDHPDDAWRYKPSGLVSTTCLGAIGRTPQSDRWGDLGRRLTIHGLYFFEALHRDSDLSRLDLLEAALGKATFENCIINETTFEASLIGEVRFVGCTMINSRFEFKTFGQGFRRRLKIETNCIVRGLVVNGAPWQPSLQEG